MEGYLLLLSTHNNASFMDRSNVKAQVVYAVLEEGYIIFFPSKYQQSRNDKLVSVPLTQHVINLKPFVHRELHPHTFEMEIKKPVNYPSRDCEFSLNDQVRVTLAASSRENMRRWFERIQNWRRFVFSLERECVGDEDELERFKTIKGAYFGPSKGCWPERETNLASYAKVKHLSKVQPII